MNPRLVINTDNSLLDGVTDRDLPVLREIFDDPQTRKYLPELYELVDSDSGLQQFVSSFAAYAQRNDGYLWGIRHDGQLTGFVATMEFSSDPAVFYAMHPDYRSRGLMKDALCSVIDYLNKHEMIRTIATDVYKENEVSINILMQLGFTVNYEDEQKFYMIKVLE